MSPHVHGCAASLPPEGAPARLGRPGEGRMSPHVHGCAASLLGEGRV